MRELLQVILDNPISSLAIIGNLILIETLLSVDNAAVLATMVMDLPKDKRAKALRYGIIGAYVFRGICLLFASMIISVWWLKPIGGLYLLVLVYNYFKSKNTETTANDLLNKKESWLYKWSFGLLGQFWATVALVEFMDIAFSIDNVFAAVAFTDNLILIWAGVFIGILAMRFVAQIFVTLMDKFKFLEICAFIVIAVLGLKLTLSLLEHIYPESTLSIFLGSHLADYLISIATVGIFFIPLITSLLFNFPKKQILNLKDQEVNVSCEQILKDEKVDEEVILEEEPFVKMEVPTLA